MSTNDTSVVVTLLNEIHNVCPQLGRRSMTIVHAATVGAANDHAALVEINHLLRVELGQLPVDTIRVRSYLGDDMSVDEWLSCFRRFVLPIMSDHKEMLFQFR